MENTAPKPIDTTTEQIKAIVEEMESEAAGARQKLVSDARFQSDDWIEGFTNRAEALEQYAKVLRKVIEQ